MTKARLTATASAVAVLVSCAPGPADDATAASGPSVVAALYPLAFVAERVGGPDIALTTLAAPGVEPHDLELSPQQVGTIVDAAVVLYLGGFAPAVDEAVEQNAADRALEAGSVLTLDDPGDPHFWLDPGLLGKVAVSLADRLGTVDPANANRYTERATALVDDLDQLDDDLETGLASCATRTIVTAHAAFGYLAERYDLEQLSVAGLEPDAEPSAARISAVQARIRADGLTTIYFEPLTSSDVVDAIAADLGLATAALDPVESIDQDSEADYVTVMRDNLATLREGQRCT